jgi:Domain of unknown function (DUF4105)
VISALTLLIATSLPPWMTHESQAPDLKISVVTFSPGDSLTEWWGHTAVIVEDVRLNQKRLYNFGMFGPREGDTGGFVKDFIKGRLIFWVAEDAVMPTFGFYKQYLNRDVRIQELDLAPEEAQAIATRLGTHVLPENRMYRYHHYNDNCSTRPRDIIDAAIGGQLKAATAGPSRITLRQHTLRYSMVDPPVSLGLDFLQADSLDKPITQQQDAYLPDELEMQLAALEVRRADGSVRPLVKKQWNWFLSNRVRPPAVAPNWLGFELLFGGVLAALAHVLGHWGRKGARLPRMLLGAYTAAFGVLFGLLGTALAFLMILTDHDVTFWNENVFQANPLSLALLPLGVMLAAGSKRAPARNRRVWLALAMLSVLGVVIKVLPIADQANWNVLAVTVPVNLGFASMWWMSKRASQA